METHAAYKTVTDTIKRERLAQWAIDMDCQSEDGELNEQHRTVYLASMGIIPVEVDGSTIPMTIIDYLIDNAWSLNTWMAVIMISSRQLPNGFKCMMNTLRIRNAPSTYWNSKRPNRPISPWI